MNGDVLSKLPADHLVMAILCCLMVITIIIIIIGCRRDMARMQKQNDDLLNRLMSVDFQSYAAGKHVMERGQKWKEPRQPEEDQDDSPRQDGIGLSVT